MKPAQRGEEAGHLTLRQREIVICRTTALCGSECKWGVHISAFGTHAGFTAAQTTSLVHGKPQDSCWTAQEQALAAACDTLHATCTWDAQTWATLRLDFSDEFLMELLMLAGFYRTVSDLTNALDSRSGVTGRQRSH